MSSSSIASLLQITFVDDNEITLMSAKPKVLLASVQKLLGSLVHVAKCTHMTINWKPGKTEGMIMLRGKKSSMLREQLRGVSGKIEVPIPGTSTPLVISSVYKYLGSMVSMSGDIVADARYKASQAMSAYAPLAIKVFASKSIWVTLKIAFAT